MRKLIAVALIVFGFLALWLLRDEAPLVRLAAATLGMIWVIKIAAVLWQNAEGLRFHSLLAGLLFFTAWPGISLQGFTERKLEPIPETGAHFLQAWLSLLAGTALLIIACVVGQGESTLWNYVALGSLLLILHLGLVEVTADGLRLLGFSPPSLFDRPFASTSLRDFWSRRWNRAFVDMNKIFLLQPLREKIPGSWLVFSIFAISGLLHELGISYADNFSWGKPLLYFVWQGLGMELEKHKKFSRALVWAWVLAPVTLLFTPHFTNLFLGGLGKFVAENSLGLGTEEFVRSGLAAGALAHLLVLCASIQVPGKLGWKKEFQKLSNLNRKVFWTYGGYIFAIILIMALVSFLLARQEALPFSLAARLWLGFIALFWWARVVIDTFYFKHADWPRGPLFTVGHICLTTLFLSLALLYTTLAIFSGVVAVTI